MSDRCCVRPDSGSPRQRPRRRRLIVDGKLIAPWVTEFVAACERAMADLNGRELIIDLRNVTGISPEGTTIFFGFVQPGVCFVGDGPA